MCRLRDLAVFLVATTWAFVAYAQTSSEQEAEKTPDEIAANEFVQELRVGAEAPREDQNAEPTEQSTAIDEWLSRIEDSSSDPDSSLEDQVLKQRVLVNELRRRYTEHHPEVMRAVRTLEQMEFQLEGEKAARSEPD